MEWRKSPRPEIASKDRKHTPTSLPDNSKDSVTPIWSIETADTNRDLLSQTENFFIGHLSSSIDTDQLAKIQQAFHNVGQIIMRQRTRGLLHVLTHSHRYVIPVQANRYNGISRLAEN